MGEIRLSADVCRCHETVVEADHHPGCGYAPKWQPATLEVPGSHIRVKQIFSYTVAEGEPMPTMQL